MTAAKNPKPIGFPITLTAEQLMANEQIAKAADEKRVLRRRGISTSALQPAEANPFASSSEMEGSRAASDQSAAPPAAQVASRAERHAAVVRASYLVGDTTPSKVDLRRGDIPGPMLLEVTSIDVYQDNPRLFRNEKRDDILVAIKAQGFHDALVVTRRREGDRFMLAAGSNTTLDVLKELWTTTGDERFRWVNCIFQPYEDDARVLAQHLGENLNRGDMKFWEIATGMMNLIGLLQADRRKADPSAKPMSIREMTEALIAKGLRADKTAVARWQFAADRLQSLGAACILLTPRMVGDVLQPRLLACRTLAAKFGISEQAYWSELVHPVFSEVGRTVDVEADGGLDADSVCNQVEAALAERVQEPVLALRQMLSALKVSPELTLADLRVPSPSLIAGASAVGSNPQGSASSAAKPPLPINGQVQRPLPLPPGAVRGDGTPQSSAPAAAASSPADQSVRQHVNHPRASRPDAQSRLFESATTAGGGDPMANLSAAIQGLLAVAGLSDTLRPCDAMPLGYFLELPDPVLHARKKVEIGSPGHQIRLLKTAVWWHLVYLSGQLGEGSVRYLDRKSRFYLTYAADDSSDPLGNTDVDRDPPELQLQLLARLAPGAMRQAMQLAREVEERAALVFEQQPERWLRMKEVQPNVL